MTRIAGSSQYLNQATLANKQGSTFAPADLLSLTSSASLLDVGRANAVKGVGISASARALNNSIIEGNKGTFNKLFSLSGGASATTAAAQIQIAALLSTAVSSRNVTINTDTGEVSSVTDLGSNIDESV